MKILSDILSATILFSIPLLLVALGGMFSERSGVINIALEGIMVIGALCACLTLRALDQNTTIGTTAPQLGMTIAILVAATTGALFSLLLAFASVSLKADQTIGGTALNMMAPAMAIAITWAVQGQGQTNIIIPTWARITQETLGVAAKDTFFQNFLFKSFYLTTPIALVLFLLAVVILYKTRFGLRLRACGEHPQAADSVGINVYRMRYSGVLISGVLAGIGGIAYTVAAGSTFQSSVAGYGFLALAVMIFGNWKPLWIALGALLFGFVKCLGVVYTTVPFLSALNLPTYFYNMLPYIIVLIVLIITHKKSGCPKAEGIPYEIGQR